MQPPRALIEDLDNAGFTDGDVLSVVGASAEIPDVPGAYVLLIGLARTVAVNTKRFPSVQFLPGWYLYSGSAYGPGGMRARVARHLRRDKRAHWHVDHLTWDATVTAMCFSGADECRLVEKLIATTDFTVPVPGFGSTDCNRCESHLVRWLPPSHHPATD